jgi:hypothetical protein
VGSKACVTEPDPSPEILAASETETSGKAPETVAERFVNAFGRTAISLRT